MRSGEAIKQLMAVRLQFEMSLPNDEDYLLLDLHARIMDEATKEAEQDNLDTIKAIDIAIKAIKETAKCDRCHKAKAAELSTSTDMCYCKRCYKAVTDQKTPY